MGLMGDIFVPERAEEKELGCMNSSCKEDEEEMRWDGGGVCLTSSLERVYFRADLW